MGFGRGELWGWQRLEKFGVRGSDPWNESWGARSRLAAHWIVTGRETCVLLSFDGREKTKHARPLVLVCCALWPLARFRSWYLGWGLAGSSTRSRRLVPAIRGEGKGKGAGIKDGFPKGPSAQQRCSLVEGCLPIKAPGRRMV